MLSDFRLLSMRITWWILIKDVVRGNHLVPPMHFGGIRMLPFCSSSLFKGDPVQSNFAVEGVQCTQQHSDLIEWLKMLHSLLIGQQQTVRNAVSEGILDIRLCKRVRHLICGQCWLQHSLNLQSSCTRSPASVITQSQLLLPQELLW